MATLLYTTTQYLLQEIQADLQSSSSKALLADFRNSITQNQNKTGLAWAFVFSRLPEQYLSESGDLTPETQAVFSALQLYALHQQGNSQTVNENTEFITPQYFTVSANDDGSGVITVTTNERTHSKYFKQIDEAIGELDQFKKELTSSDVYKKTYTQNIGHALRRYRLMNEDKKAIDRRFNAMITANSYNELITHLRHLISILKSNTSQTVDYAQLADDLCQFNKSVANQERIKLAWSQSYYRSEKKGETKNEK